MASYRGLSNQGATCYMNSLLQTLYMTPDLRHQLYLWTFTETSTSKPEDSIPYQLQLLFGRLQLSRAPTVDTKGLTRSFQWDLRESFVQHDVQEFCRVLFDAIERSVKSTPQSTLINDLYQGVLEDYVRCLACGTESKREDMYLDVSLAVRNQFDRTYNDSLEKALSSFVKAERLSGDNQYNCDACKSKQDAIKGLRFKSFPKVFVMQLKRFDLDMRTFAKKKINDLVSFPFVLNLNPYLGEHINSEVEEAERSAETQVSLLPADYESRSISLKRYERKEALNEDRDKPSLEPDPLSREFTAKHGEKLQKEERSRQIAAYLEQGEQVYELFSVMVHSGSAHGGHYYAYIWSFEQEQWLKFNDSNVKLVTTEEVKTTFGGEGRGVLKACANAYLLTFRKVSAICSVPDSLVPDYIRREMGNSLEEEKTESEITTNLIVLYENQRKIFKPAGSTLLRDFLVTVLAAMSETDHFSSFRLRSYRSERRDFPVNYSGREEDSLSSLHFCSYQALVLEKKDSDGGFVEYDPDAMYLKVVLWKQEDLSLAEKVAAGRKVAVNKFAKMQNLMEKIEKMTGFPSSRLAVVRRITNYYSASSEILSKSGNMQKSLSELRLFESAVLYAEEIEEGAGPYRWLREFELDLYRIQVRFNAPGDPAAESPSELLHRVLIDNRLDLRSLKAAIAHSLSLSPDTFILRRGFSATGQEMRNLDLKLNSLNMGLSSCLYVEQGVPLKADEMRIHCTLAGEQVQGSDDGICFTAFPLCSLIINSSETVKTVKSQLISKATELYPTLLLEANCCILREQVQDRFGRVLRDSQRLKDLQFFEQSKLCVQKFAEAVPELGVKDIVVSCRRWWPSMLQLEAPIHIILNKGGTQFDMGKQLESLFAIPVEKIEVYKVSDLLNFSRAKLNGIGWVGLGNKREKVEQYPVSLTSDGYLLIVKDKSEVKSDVAQDIKNSKLTEKAHFKRKPGTEKPIIITVKGEAGEKE